MTENNLPSLNKDDAVEELERTSRNLIPWLPDPYSCDDCGALCYAETEFVASQAMYCDVWVCKEDKDGCGSRYYRDE